jgi:tetratricopeptide (TPR) repeat protein
MKPSKLSSSMLTCLRDDLSTRRICDGLKLLEIHRDAIHATNTTRRKSFEVVECLAQWVDIGFDGLEVLKCLLGRLSKIGKGSLRVSDYCRLQLAGGLTLMLEERFEDAIGQLEHGLAFARGGVLTEHSIAIANFWTARCHRRVGHYDRAMHYTVKAREVTESLGSPRMAAVMRILESWLIFQNGDSKKAEVMLKEAGVILAETDDYVSIGNIHSALGRIARRGGKYDLALDYLTRAKDAYKERDRQHRNVARSLVNISSVERLIGLGLLKSIDRHVETRRKNKKVKPSPASPQGKHMRLRFQQIQAKASAHLDAAMEIYCSHNDHRGLGNVHLNFGYLSIDRGDLSRAEKEAAETYRLGKSIGDHFLIARARILQSAIEGAKYEEQVDELLDWTQHGRLACDYAREAIDHASLTENIRLQAKASIALGLALSKEPSYDLEGARECVQKVSKLLKYGSRDYLQEGFQTLRKMTLMREAVAPKLREWSSGLVDGKTFKQITEEFAGIVIPQVWRLEGKKVARVAARLAISPKKVRRILASQGLQNSKPPYK